jgi:hypothetical protein
MSRLIDQARQAILASFFHPPEAIRRRLVEIGLKKTK